MQIVIVILSILLACVVASTSEGSSMSSIEELMSKIQEYEDSIHDYEKESQILENEISEIDSQMNVSEYIKEIEMSQDQLRQLDEITYISHLYRAELLKIEPTLCLPHQKLTGTYEMITDYKSFEVSCGGDDVAGPGWIVIQRRISNDLSFQQDFISYERGFGNPTSNFFIGLQKLHELTSLKPYELYIRLENLIGETRYAHYSCFLIGHRHEKYELKSLGKYNGNAGNALIDALGQDFNSGWWIGCNYSGAGSNLNANSSLWQTWPESFKSVEMMIRPQLKQLKNDCRINNKGFYTWAKNLFDC